MINNNTRNAIFFCIAFGFFFLIGDLSAQAQTSKIKSKPESEEAKAALRQETKAAAPGTYQFLAKDAGSHEVFPYNILVKIEENRHQNKVVYMKAGESTLVKILPYKTINSKKFVPLPEYGVQQ